MAMILDNTEAESDLQRRIRADLNSRQSAKPLVSGDNLRGKTSLSNKAAFQDDYQKASLPGWVYAGIVLAILIICVLLIVQSTRG